MQAGKAIIQPLDFCNCCFGPLSSKTVNVKLASSNVKILNPHFAQTIVKRSLSFTEFSALQFDPPKCLFRVNLIGPLSKLFNSASTVESNSISVFSSFTSN